MTWWPQAWMPRNTNRPRTWPDVSAKTGNPIFDLSLHQALSPPIIWPSRPSASSCWIAMSRRELAVSEDRSGVSESGPPSPPAPSNNEASLNSCIRPSTTISRDGPHLHYFPQARERIQYIERFMHPATLMLRGGIHLFHSRPEAHGTISNRQFGSLHATLL